MKRSHRQKTSVIVGTFILLLSVLLAASSRVVWGAEDEDLDIFLATVLNGVTSYLFYDDFSDPYSGLCDIGLCAQSYASGDVDVRFDNFIVSE